VRSPRGCCLAPECKNVLLSAYRPIGAEGDDAHGGAVPTLRRRAPAWRDRVPQLPQGTLERPADGAGAFGGNGHPQVLIGACVIAGALLVVLFVHVASSSPVLRYCVSSVRTTPH
jgi:hypothetical protein